MMTDTNKIVAGEHWLPIADHPGFEVSDMGHVRQIGATRMCMIYPCGWQGTVMTTEIPDANGKIRQRSVARLVAEAFCERPEGATRLTHMDGDSTNNSAANLRWQRPCKRPTYS